LSHPAGTRRPRPVAREIAEVVRYAAGYQSRAFVTFGRPIPLDGHDPESRRGVMALGHQIRDTIGALYKVLPTAIVAAAMRPSTTKRDLEGRADTLIDALRQANANLAVHTGRDAVESGAPM